MTLHRACNPHVPGQGSEHFCAIHALSIGHSALTTHSGRQDGGVPIKPCIHEQTAL